MPRKGIARPQAASAAGAQATGVRTRASVNAAGNSVPQRPRTPKPTLESRGAASPPGTGHSDHSSPLPPTPIHPPPLGYPLRFRTPPPPAPSHISPLPDLPFICDCGRSFRTQAGLSIHSRRAHAEAFHASLAARVSQRGSSHMHWSDDELILLARLEVQLAVTGRVRALNQRLAVAFTGRTLQAIKGVRRASNLRDSGFLTAIGANAGGANAAAEGLPAAAGAGPQGVPYVSLTPIDVTVDAIAAGIARRPRRAAVPEGRTRPVAVDLPAPLDSTALPAAALEVAGDDRSVVEPAAGEDRPAEVRQDPEGTMHWFEQLWGKIRDGDLKLPRPQATPVALTDEIRSWVDREYALWAPAAAPRNNSPRPAAPPPRSRRQIRRKQYRR